MVPFSDKYLASASKEIVFEVVEVEQYALGVEFGNGVCQTEINGFASSDLQFYQFTDTLAVKVIQTVGKLAVLLVFAFNYL